MKPANRNLLWSSIFVDELIRAGVSAACIAPGSRSTPLTFAFAARPEIKTYSLLDERGASFFALGLAQSGGRPAALVCTSGTAAANFLPALVEASQSEIPMLVLTADRPDELRHSGANQTIDQLKLYGDYARWFVQVPAPEPDPSTHLLSSLRTIADRAVAVALGLDGTPGPVHLNFPFRKPLEPTPTPGDLSPEWSAAHAADPALHGRPDGAAFVRIQAGRCSPASQQVDRLAEQIRHARRGLVVCGPRCPGGDFPSAVTELARAAGFPILADPLSGLRFGAQAANPLVLGGYETFLASGDCRDKLPPPGLVLRFGDLPTSAALGSYLAALPAQQIAVGVSARWADDMFVLGEVVRADALEICTRMREQLNCEPDDGFAEAWLCAESAAWQALDAFRTGEGFEGALLAEVVENLPDGAQLYVANSLPVRHLDQFVRPRPAELRVFANRGASGIDGTVSAALGAAAGSDRPLVLVTGDLSFYHDLNGLLAFKRCGVRATLVLIHNDGGGIFQRLPSAQFDPPFTELILTPHGLDFASAAQMFGLEYRLLNGVQALGAALKEAVGAERPHILAIRTDAVHGEQIRKKIIKQYR